MRTGASDLDRYLGASPPEWFLDGLGYAAIVPAGLAFMLLNYTLLVMIMRKHDEFRRLRRGPPAGVEELEREREIA